MSFDYRAFLVENLNNIIESLKSDSAIAQDIKIIISDEQEFVEKEKEPDTLYFVFKRMNGSQVYSVNTQPYQLLMVSEQNQLDYAKTICDTFVSRYNYTVNYAGTTFIKHTYKNPVVLSNFNEIGYGSRSIIYIGAELLILDNVLVLNVPCSTYKLANLNKIQIDNEIINVIGFTLNYAMTPDSQQYPSGEFIESKKSTASVNITFSIALTDTSFIKKCLNIIKGNYSGDITFSVYFYLGPTDAGISFSYNMKLINCQLEDNPDQAPGLRIGLSV